MTEGAPKPNPFELIDHQGMLVPRFLLEPDRDEDFQEYAKGWGDQSRSSVKLVSKTRNDPDGGMADNWYKTGATKYWTNHGEPTDIDSDNSQPQDLDRVMGAMRTNARIVPHAAYSQDDYGSDTKADVIPYERDVIGKIGQEVDDESHADDYNA